MFTAARKPLAAMLAIATFCPNCIPSSTEDAVVAVSLSRKIDTALI